jgi:transposase
LATEPANQVAPRTDEQAAPSLACTTIELPGGVRIRVKVPRDWQPGQRVEAIREAQQIADDAEESKKKRRKKRPEQCDRKFPEHLPRYERVVDLPEDQSEGLTLIGDDEVETLECTAAELKVRVTKYAKYALVADKTKGIVSPARPTGLVEGDRFDASVGVEVVAWKYFYHLPFYRQQDMFGGRGWTPSRSTLQNIETAVDLVLRPHAEYLRSVLTQDKTVGCDDTGVLLITSKAMPDLTDHPRADRIGEVIGNAIESGKPSIKANM